MCRQNCGVKSSQEEEVASAEENLLIYCKPVRLYNILHLRSLHSPSFLPRCLNYNIQLKGKRKSRSARVVVFNYKDCNNIIQKTEVIEDCSCPFCFMLCGDIKGLQLHLSSSHELFEFEFRLSEEYQEVNVSVKLAAFEFEELGSCEDRFETFSFCLKPRKRSRRDGSNHVKRLNVQFLELDSHSLANNIENGITLLNNGNHCLGYPEATQFSGQFGTTNNILSTPPAIAHSFLDSDAKPNLTSEPMVPVTKTKKLSAERSEARSYLLLQKRQFYHSHRVQPMALEQVMSDRDSEDEVDDDLADLEDRQMLDDFVDVSRDEKKFMHLWNSFVRKQRVIADGHISWACEAFSKFHQKDLLRCSSLFWCWRLFLIKLWNHGLLDASTIDNCNKILESYRNNSGAASSANADIDDKDNNNDSNKDDGGSNNNTNKDDGNNNNNTGKDDGSNNNNTNKDEDSNNNTTNKDDGGSNNNTDSNKDNNNGNTNNISVECGGDDDGDKNNKTRDDMDVEEDGNDDNHTHKRMRC